MKKNNLNGETCDMPPTDIERVIEATHKTLDQYGKTFKDLAEFDKSSPTPEESNWEVEFETLYDTSPAFNGEESKKILIQFIYSRLLSERQRLVWEVEKWVLENHDHHNFVDEKLPKGINGCIDKDFPYVNSLSLVKFLKEGVK